MKRIIAVICLLFGAFVSVKAQPFREDIQRFKKMDSLNTPSSNAILFVGSSSFTYWKDVANYFPGYTIINRGFGGSSLTDLIYYESDVIFPYQPKQIVMYCGENDLAGSDTVDGQVVFERFMILFNDIRKRFPEVPLAYVSMKPSPSRFHLMNKMEVGNHLIKDFLSTRPFTSYIDVYHRMLDVDGKPLPEIFVEDNLHMNSKGYAIWQKAIQPYLLK